MKTVQFREAICEAMSEEMRRDEMRSDKMRQDKMR